MNKGLLIYVPGNAVPRPCPLCRTEIVRTASDDGLVSIEYASIKEHSNGKGKPPRYAGHEHHCPAVVDNKPARSRP